MLRTCSLAEVHDLQGTLQASYRIQLCISSTSSTFHIAGGGYSYVESMKSVVFPPLMEWTLEEKLRCIDDDDDDDDDDADADADAHAAAGGYDEYDAYERASVYTQWINNSKSSSPTPIAEVVRRERNRVGLSARGFAPESSWISIRIADNVWGSWIEIDLMCLDYLAKRDVTQRVEVDEVVTTA